jgi:hypothetical protein
MAKNVMLNHKMREVGIGCRKYELGKHPSDQSSQVGNSVHHPLAALELFSTGSLPEHIKRNHNDSTLRILIH